MNGRRIRVRNETRAATGFAHAGAANRHVFF
jgi:hypothetical protein